jgi:long-chain acyl-CoA synthetase
VASPERERALNDWFFERLKSFGEDKALVYPTASGERVASYRDLLEAKERFGAELGQRGIGAGDVVAVEGAFTLSATALILALIEAQAVALPMVREMRAQRDACLGVAEAEWLFEFDEEDNRTVTDLRPVHRTNKTLEKLRERKSPGLVIFSSGSTGQPKGILHDFAQILKKFEKVRQKKVTLCFLLFDHIGGVDTLLSTLTSGGTLVTVARRDPATVVETIERHRVHTLPTSPTFLNLLLISGLVEKHDLSSLRVIAYGTEPMPAGTLARLHATFPEVALVQTYGMSEVGVLRSRSKDSNSPWIEFSQEGFQVDVRDGILWVKAETAMLGYLNAPDLFDEDGWLNTQDAVEVDGPYFRILGRKTDLINVGGQKVYPTEVEGCLLEMPNVRDVSVFGKPNPMTGQMVAARFNLIEPEPLAEFKVRMFAFCRSRLAAYQIPRAVEIITEDQFGARFKKSRREH